MVDSMGGKCQICGYDKCIEALEFHHINPNEKEFGLASIRANPISWKKLVVELKKCILLCNRCHSEIHYGFVQIPDNYEKFNEEYENYIDKQKQENYDECPICKKLKNKIQKTCSYKCAAKLSWSVDWSKVDLRKELEDGKSYTQIADELNISIASVKKRCVKLGIDYLNKFKK